MQRRELLQRAAAFGLLSALPFSAARRLFASPAARPNPLTPPAAGSIPVAFLISEGAVVIDFCGPWEVFQDVMVHGNQHDAFQLYTVAETANPIRASAGMKIVPDYTLANAPAPKVIVIPAQSGRGPAILNWIRTASRTADLTMSVCTGAFLLASTGLLSGKAATTHHGFYSEFAMRFPDVHLRRGVRFVEDGSFACAGGLSSGMDLALRVVERYYGRDVATRTADNMEYQGKGWLNAASNAAYAIPPVSTAAARFLPAQTKT